MMQDTSNLCRGAQFLTCFTIIISAFAPDLLRAQAAPKSATDTLCVMTYNLRFASPNPPNARPQRRPLMCELSESLNWTRNFPFCSSAISTPRLERTKPTKSS